MTIAGFVACSRRTYSSVQARQERCTSPATPTNVGTRLVQVASQVAKHPWRHRPEMSMGRCAYAEPACETVRPCQRHNDTQARHLGGFWDDNFQFALAIFCLVFSESGSKLERWVSMAFFAAQFCHERQLASFEGYAVLHLAFGKGY